MAKTFTDGEILYANDLNSVLNEKELSSNKTQTIDASSNETQFPSAKAVYNALISVLSTPV